MQNTRFFSALPLVAALLVVGVVAPTAVHAQNTDEEAPDEAPDEAVEEERGAGFFSIGTQFADLGALNNRLAGAGYPTFSSEMVSLGGGGYGVVANRLLLGGEGHGLLTAEGARQTRNVSVGGGYGLFNIGYLFSPAPHVRAYPLLGLGGGGLQLDIESAGTADNFDEVLDDPNRSATVGRASLLVSLGGGLEYQFGTPGDGRSARLGLRAGYLIAALSSDWQLDENALAGGPDASMQGPFVRLTIGEINLSGDDE